MLVPYVRSCRISFVDWAELATAGGQGNRSARHDPLRRLAGDLRDQLVVIVAVQGSETFSFGRRRDEQARQAADCSDAPARRPWAWVIGRAVPGPQSRRTHRRCASPSPMLRQPSIPRREARSVSPRRRTGRPDDSSTWTRPLTTPTSSAPLWAKGASTVADRGRETR